MSTAGSSLLKALWEVPLGRGCLGFTQCKWLLLFSDHVSTATPQGLFARESPRGGDKQHQHFGAAVLDVHSALHRARGAVFTSDHSWSFIPQLSEGSHTAHTTWLPGWPFSVAPAMGLAPQRRLLLFVPLPCLLQKKKKGSYLLCLGAVPSIHTPAVTFQFEQVAQ